MSTEPAATATPQPAPFGPVAGVSKDRDGRTFDAAKFLPEKDGNGRWKRIGGPGKPGRPRGSVSAPKSPESQPAAAVAPSVDLPGANFDDVKKLLGSAPTASAPGDSQVEPGAVSKPRDKYDIAALGTVSAVATLGIMTMGAHVAPKPDEIAAMVKSYADCYRHYGYAPEPPPWLAPAIATAAWVAPHLQDRRSQEKLQTWKARIVAFWLKLRGRRDARVAAQVSTAVAAAVPN